MSPPLIKLGSCIGYTARLSRKIGAPREVSEHMQQALHYLTQFTKELKASAPPEPKRRKIISLSNCLRVETSACHQSCQTDQHLVEEEEVVAQVAALVADMNAKSFETVSGQVQEFHKEVSQMVARQAQQHADARVDMEHSVAQLQVEMDTLLATIRDKDREIARLKTDTTSASVMASRVSCPLPDAAEHGPCEAARFLTIADAAQGSVKLVRFILVICKTFISRKSCEGNEGTNLLSKPKPSAIETDSLMPVVHRTRPTYQ
eukprot:symbB.v1.2.041033.t1/scaffold7761.1/size9445/1